MESIWVYLVAALLVISALYWLENKLKSVDKSKNMKALEYALTDLNEVVDNKLFVGKDSNVIYKRKVKWNYGGKFGFVSYVCLTNNGTWFELAIEVVNGSIRSRNIIPISTDSAKQRLSANINLYKQHFGEPEKA